jgi:geranylgeranyl pyrophosphate synthase
MVDDIEDHSQLRRGQICAHLLFGTEIALNAGNMLYFWPLLALEKMKIKPVSKLAILELVNREMIKVSIGQGMDIWWSQRANYAITPTKYNEMAANKTSALISLAMQIGAIAAGATPKQQKIIEALAVEIGLAYQIRDDVLNLRPSNKWGKLAGEDLAEGKLTWLVVDFMTKATPTDRIELTKRLKRKSNKKKEIEASLKLLDKYEIFAAAAREIKKHQKAALTKIGQLKFNKKLIPIWHEFIDYLGSRDK